MNYEENLGLDPNQLLQMAAKPSFTSNMGNPLIAIYQTENGWLIRHVQLPNPEHRIRVAKIRFLVATTDDQLADLFIACTTSQKYQGSEMPDLGIVS